MGTSRFSCCVSLQVFNIPKGNNLAQLWTGNGIRTDIYRYIHWHLDTIVMKFTQYPAPVVPSLYNYLHFIYNFTEWCNRLDTECKLWCLCTVYSAYKGDINVMCLETHHIMFRWSLWCVSSARVMPKSPGSYWHRRIISENSVLMLQQPAELAALALLSLLSWLKSVATDPWEQPTVEITCITDRHDSSGLRGTSVLCHIWHPSLGQTCQISLVDLLCGFS